MNRFTYDYKNYLGFLWPSSDLNLLRSDKLGSFRTASLFREYNKTSPDKYPSLYTLSEEEKDGLPSAYQIYMHSTDEYEAAIKLVGTMKLWKRLCGQNWFMTGKNVMNFDGLESWREDMKLRDASMAKKTLLDQISRGNVSASQSVVNKLGLKNSVGRPIKDKDTDQEAEKIQKIVSLAKNITKE